ncbi:MAG: hypothetical protein ACW99G_14725 [Candidatus Thorarchaeota archaeon]|jgi:hypothetical protein
MAREYITKDVFRKTNAASLSEVFKQQADNIEDLQGYLQDFLEELEGLRVEGEFRDPTTFGGIEDLNNAIYRKAFMDCVEVIQDKAMNFLVTEAVKAVVATQEFNYDLYVEHLLSAMEVNQKKIIAIIPHEESRSVEVKVNLNILGKPEEWGKAIEAYRKAKKLGRSRGRTGEHGEMSSYFWKEKIYGAGREGTRVQKGKPKKDAALLRTRKAKKQRRRLDKDITEKYRGKYKETIAGRLSFIPGGKSKAPFWHLIEHGNANVDLGIDADGVPYPTFGPTNFARNSEEAIASAFRQLWDQYLEAATNFIRQLQDERVTEMLEHYTPSEEAIRRTKEEKTELRKLKRLRGRVRGKRTRDELEPGGKLQAFIDTERGRYEAYLQGETIRISLRDPKSGRFVKLPWRNWENVAEIYGVK